MSLYNKVSTGMEGLGQVIDHLWFVDSQYR